MARPASKCLKLVTGRRIRVTRLDGCGRFVYGDASTVTSSGFITVGYTANTIETDEIDQQNAAGERCVYKAARTRIVGYGIEITFCAVDVELFNIVTGSPLVLDADGAAIGFDVDTSVDLSGLSFGLELWAGTSEDDACEPGGGEKNGYLLSPFIQGGIVGDLTVENGAVNFTLTAANTRDGSPWGVGPYNDVMYDELDVLGPMVQPIGTTVPLRTLEVNAAPPAAACGARPLMDPDAEEILTLVGTPSAGLEVDFTVTPAAIDTPVYYEFGDGTWDYIDASADGATSHVYPAAGTYTARATSNGVWVEDEVTAAP